MDDDRLFPVAAEKRCSKCDEVKPLDEFNRLSKAADGRQSYCRDCNKAYHYANWDRHMSQIRARVRRRRRENQAQLMDYLGAHPCVDCGECDLVVLEFDHVRDKHRNVSYLVQQPAEWRRIADEIEKCEVVCANCHRRRTASRGGWYRTKPLDSGPQASD